MPFSVSFGSVPLVAVTEIKAINSSKDLPDFYADIPLKLFVFFFFFPKYMICMGKAMFKELA